MINSIYFNITRLLDKGSLQGDSDDSSPQNIHKDDTTLLKSYSNSNRKIDE